MTVNFHFDSPVSPQGPVNFEFGAGSVTTIAGAVSAGIPVAVAPVALQAQGRSLYLARAALAASLAVPALPVALAARGKVGPRTLPAELAAGLPLSGVGLGLVGAVHPVLPSQAAAGLPLSGAGPVAIDVRAEQHLDLPDADGVRAQLRHARAARTGAALGVTQQTAQRLPVPAGMRHAAMLPATSATTVRHTATDRARVCAVVAHQQAHALGSRARMRAHDTVRTRAALDAPHQHGLIRACSAFALHAETLRSRLPVQMWHQHGHPVEAGRSVRAQHGLALARGLIAVHQHMIALPVGGWQPAWPWPDPPGNPHSSPAHLAFCRLSDDTANLIFGCPHLTTPDGQVVVPVLESYLVINTFHLVRADTGQALHPESFTARIDRDSWCWQWSMRIHAATLPLLRSIEIGQPVELIATINGTPLHLLVVSVGRDRRFGEQWLSAAGRGRAALLADPYSPIVTRSNAAQARTARQLLDDALTINNVPIGWDIDWQLEDWLVGAGSWQHTGTYAQAVMRIAEAGGGYVQGHDTDQTLRILPHYRDAPWAWPDITPDLSLPEQVCEFEGFEWIERPQYNAVWVTGTDAHGRADRILRNGTAADLPAQMIVEPLATAPAATRQRGLVAIADTGKQAHIQLRLPVLQETGIIHPGLYVHYTESTSGVAQQHIGVTRSVSVEYRGLADVWQTVGIETHEHESI